MNALTETIDTLAASERELRFQADRLTARLGDEADMGIRAAKARMVERQTENPDVSRMNETEHLSDLRDGYLIAAHYTKVLLRSQKGRLEREELAAPDVEPGHDPFAPVGAE